MTWMIVAPPPAHPNGFWLIVEREIHDAGPAPSRRIVAEVRSAALAERIIAGDRARTRLPRVQFGALMVLFGAFVLLLLQVAFLMVQAQASVIGASL